MSTDEIKLQIFREIDALDASKVKEVYGLLLNYINSKGENSEWIGVSKREQEGIEAALKELENGEGVTNNLVLDLLNKKYSHD